MWRTPRALVVVVATLAGTLAGTGAFTPAAPAGADSSWVVASSQNPGSQDNELQNVSCASSTFCVGVGNTDTSTLIETFDGTSWTTSAGLSGPSGSAQNQLLGVSCTSASFCVAVGSYEAESGDESGLNQDLIEMWNGTSWSDASVNPYSDDTLVGVSCTSASFCVAVGNYKDSDSYDQVFVETWDGTSWTSSVGADTSSTVANYVEGVSCTSTSFCMAVGYTGRNADTLAESFDGTSWSLNLPLDPGESPNLYGVSCTSVSFCMAVGYTYDSTSGLNDTLAESFDGTSWTTSPSVDSDGNDGQLQGVSCTSASFCMAVGYDASNSQTLAETFDGTSWTLSLPLNPGSGSNSLLGVTCTSASCVADGWFNVNVSPYYDQTLGETWTPASAPGPAPTSFSITVNGVASATVAPGVVATLTESGLAPTASGTVVFSSPGTLDLCTITLPGTSCPTSTSLPVDSYTPISATFVDTDGNYLGSTATNTVSLTVQVPTTALQGIDLGSAGPASITWSDVAGNGDTFAYLDATQSDDFTNPNFQSYWNGALDAGVTPGATLIVDGTVSAADQATYFENAVGADYGTGDLVPAIDTSVLSVQAVAGDCSTLPVEDAGCITVTQATGVLSALVGDLTSYFGVAPVIYTNPTLWGFLGDPTGYGADPLWDSDLGSTAPSTASLPNSDWFGDGWSLWQSSFTGSVPGITGDVDLDQASGTTLPLDTSAAPGPAPTSFSITVNGVASATVAPGVVATLAESGLAPTASGTVVFSSPGTLDLCTITLPGTSCPTSTSLPVDSYTPISATFVDTDGNYLGSTATNTVSLTVQVPTTALQGIDLGSAGPASITWSDVAGNGDTFAYLDATQSDDFTNPNFQSYWNGALDAGVTPGATLIVDGTVSAADQATYFENAVGADYGTGDLVPAIDTSVLSVQAVAGDCSTLPVEDAGCITVTQATGVLSALVGDLTSYFGVAPVIYTNPTLWGFLGDPTGYGADPLWDSDLGSTAPSTASLPNSDWFGDGWSLWQSSFTGSVPGITGDVDLDQASGTTLPTITCVLGASSCASATSATPGGTAEAANAGVTATATGGEGTISVGQYPSDPVGALNQNSNEFIDVSLSGVTTPFTTVSIVDCSLNGGDILSWWNGSNWLEVSPQSPTPIGCVTATLSSTSSPTISQLTGTVFAVSTNQVVDQPVTVTVSGTMTYGGTPNLTYAASPAVALSGSLSCTTVDGGSAIANLGVGYYTVDGSSCSDLSAPGADSITYVGAAGGFAVSRAPLTITASGGSFTFGGTPTVVTASYHVLVNGDSAASLTTPPTCSSAATSTSPVGSYPSTCNGAVDANYVISYVAGVVRVTAAATQLSLQAFPSGPLPLGSSVLFRAAVSKGSGPGTLTGTVSFTNNGVAIPSCTNLHLVLGAAWCATSYKTVGIHAIAATYAGDPDYSDSSATLAQVAFQAPLVTSASHVTATTGTTLNFQITASGYPVPSVSEKGALPKGLSLSVNGILSGVPAPATGGTYLITIVASNSYGVDHQIFVLSVEQPPTITSANKYVTSLGKFFVFPITATGYPAASFSEKGALPRGVSLSVNGILSGTPLSAGTYEVTITATNSAGSVQQSFTLVT
jgi:GH25 family lysozyme M1 (1,4-beta-N-acetylmuramidase)